MEIEIVPHVAKEEKAIKIARNFLWVAFFVVIVVGVVLSLFVGRATFSDIIKSQEEYLELLAEDFNSHLFRRFTFAVIASGESVSLGNESQYELLDSVVADLISGLRVRDVMILSEEGQVVYSTDRAQVEEYDEDVGDLSKLYSKEIELLFFEKSTVSSIKSLFQPALEENTFLASVYYPLSVSDEFSSLGIDESILGVLKITIDITSSYQDVIVTQRTILFLFLFSVLGLFSVMQYIYRKANNSISQRIEENKNLENQLHHQEKLASMGRMVASIAHELRNPLGILQSSSELLRSKNAANLDESSQKIIDVMIDEIKRLGNIVTDFVDYARPKKIQYKEVNLSFVLRKAITFLEPRFNSTEIKLEINIEDNVNISGDEGLLYRVFYNVISNGIQALEETEEPMLRISLFQEHDDVKILITDNGLGFSSEALEKAMDPFFTTKDDGIGLGIPIVYSIIEAHEGDLKLYNIYEENNNQGACVEITFNKNN